MAGRIHIRRLTSTIGIKVIRFFNQKTLYQKKIEFCHNWYWLCFMDYGIMLTLSCVGLASMNLELTQIGWYYTDII